MHHIAVAPSSSSLLDYAARGWNYVGKDPSRLCHDVMVNDSSSCHGQTLHMLWSNSFPGMVALVS